MAWETNDDFLRLLAKLGVADANGRIQAGAIVDAAQVASGAVQNTVYVLSTCTLPAGFLTRASKGLLIIASLLTAANANNKDVTVKLGATAICTITASALNAKVIQIVLLVLRTAVDAQVCIPLLVLGDGALLATPLQTLPTAAIAEAAAIAVTLTSANTAAAAASATGKALVVIELG